MHRRGRYNVRELEPGVLASDVPGWTVEYPSACNGRVGDVAFVSSRGVGGSGFVHFDVRTGEPYGFPLTVAARDRLRAMRRDFPHPSVAREGRVTA
jgi:hypothetical protein